MTLVGRLVTLGASAPTCPPHPERADVSEQVGTIVGRATDMLPRFAESGGNLFDLMFIETDKESNALYLDWAIRVRGSGTVMVSAPGAPSSS